MFEKCITPNTTPIGASAFSSSVVPIRMLSRYMVYRFFVIMSEF